MNVIFSIFRTCFNYDLLIYSMNFINRYKFTFFSTFSFFQMNSITKDWFLKSTTLIIQHKFIYKNKEVYFYKKSFLKKRTFYNYKFKIIELAFAFLAILFFKSPFLFPVSLIDYLRFL
jgi:hypothetical protein